MSCAVRARRGRWLALALCGLSATCGAEGLVLGATRLILDEDAPETHLVLSNTGQRPLLLQSWIDAGDAQADPAAVDVPLAADAPLLRIEPQRTAALRVRMLATGALDRGREHLYYLNVLDVPATAHAAAAEQPRFALAVRSRIKVFYRPAGLPGHADSAPAALQWRVTGDGLQVRNPTPWFVNLTRCQWNGVTLEDHHGVVPPWSERVLAANGPADPDRAALRCGWVDESGVERHLQAVPEE